MKTGKRKKTEQRVNIVGDLADEIIDRFPNTSSLSLAKMLRRDNPRVYASVEQARNAIRYRRGASGRKNRTHTDLDGPTTPPPMALPESDAEPWEPFVLPKPRIRYLLLADWHIPYHDRAACEAFLDYGVREKCSGVIILGDMVDCHHLSTFEKDPRARCFAGEIEMTKTALLAIQTRLQPEVFLWKLGNHEERFQRYMFRHAPALVGVEGFNFNQAFGLDALGVECIQDQRPIVTGRLFLLHGHEYARNMLSPVNPARGVFLRAHTNAVVAHSHTPSAHSSPDFAGRVISCWSLGCGCDLHPQYRRMNQWAHGFGILDAGGDAPWELRNYKVIDGRVVPA